MKEKTMLIQQIFPGKLKVEFVEFFGGCIVRKMLYNKESGEGWSKPLAAICNLNTRWR